MGGPLSQEVVDAYPGDKKFIKHLEETTGFEYRTGMPRVDPRFLKFLEPSPSPAEERLRRSPKVSASTSAKKSPNQQTEQSPLEESKGGTSRKEPGPGSRVMVSPRSLKEGLKAAHNTDFKDIRHKGRALAVGDKYDQASQGVPLTDRKPMGHARENRSGGNLSRNCQYSELGPMDSHMSDDNATV